MWLLSLIIPFLFLPPPLIIHEVSRSIKVKQDETGIYGREHPRTKLLMTLPDALPALGLWAETQHTGWERIPVILGTLCLGGGLSKPLATKTLRDYLIQSPHFPEQFAGA